MTIWSKPTVDPHQLDNWRESKEEPVLYVARLFSDTYMCTSILYIHRQFLLWMCLTCMLHVIWFPDIIISFTAKVGWLRVTDPSSLGGKRGGTQLMFSGKIKVMYSMNKVLYNKSRWGTTTKERAIRYKWNKSITKRGLSTELLNKTMNQERKISLI